MTGTTRKATNPLRHLDREDGGEEPAQRIRDQVDRWDLQSIQDVAKERSCQLEQIHTRVVERVRQPVSRQIDSEHAAVPREIGKDRHPSGRTAERAVDQQQWGACAEL